MAVSWTPNVSEDRIRAARGMQADPYADVRKALEEFALRSGVFAPKSQPAPLVPNVIRPPAAYSPPAEPTQAPPATSPAAKPHMEIVPMEEMVASLVADGFTPEQAARIAASDMRVTGGTPRGLHERNQTPAVQAARRKRIQDGKAADARMGRFEANYNAATGAPGWGYDAQGMAVRMDEPADAPRELARPPMDRALAAEEADREQTRGMMDQQIAARRQGEDEARAKGFKGQQDRQDRTLERTQAGGRDVLRGQWERQMIDRYKAVADESFIEDLYSRHSKDENGNPRTHAESVKAIAASGELRQLRNRQGMSGAMATQRERDAAVAANAKQYHEARKMAGPQGRAMLANTMIGAQNPFDLARAAAGAHALDPNAGWGNLAMGMGAEAANAEAVAGMGGQRQGPVAQLDDDRALVQQKPLGQRAQGYRDIGRGMNMPGQPINPELETNALINEGRNDASAAAAAMIAGAGGDEERAFLGEWTNAFVDSVGGPSPTAFQKWARRLGIEPTEEAMSLWHDLTGTSGRTWVQAIGEGLGFNPVPSVKDKK